MQTSGPATSPASSSRVRQARWAAAIGLILGLAFELLLDGHAPGISLPIWVVLCLVGLLVVARMERARRSRQGTAWVLAILAMALIFPFRLEPMTVFLCVVLTLLAITLWVDTLIPGDLLRFGWIDFARSAFGTPLLMLVRPWPVLGDAWHKSVREDGWRKPLFAGLRGVLLAIPILAVFIALLASADVVFSDYVQEALAWLDLDRLADLVSRGFVVVIVGLVCLGALAVGIQGTTARRRIGEDRPLVSPFLGFTETAIVLFLMDLVFAAFVAIQFAYLFGGQSNIHAAGYTYAEYARRGFGELVWAAALSLGLIYVLAQVSRREGRAQTRGFNLLSALQVLFLGVVLASAYKRLVLYEAAYGFTRLRTYTHIAIVWIGIALVVFIVLLLAARLRRFAPAAVLGAAGFALSLAALDVDAFIVEKNTQRYSQTQDLDTAYLLGLSDDAVPGLVELSALAPLEAKEQILADLSCRRTVLLRWQAAGFWPSAHLSRLRALDALNTVEVELEPYVVQPAPGSTWQGGPLVVDLDGEPYWCGGLGWD